MSEQSNPTTHTLKHTIYGLTIIPSGLACIALATMLVSPYGFLSLVYWIAPTAGLFMLVYAACLIVIERRKPADSFKHPLRTTLMHIGVSLAPSTMLWLIVIWLWIKGVSAV